MIRVLLRYSVYASVGWSNAFDMLFPLCLLVLIRFRINGIAQRPFTQINSLHRSNYDERYVREDCDFSLPGWP